MSSKTAEGRFTALDAERSSYLTRCEDYAAKTIPHLLQTKGTDYNQENGHSMDSVGATLINSLANKVVTTIFPPQFPFFARRLTRAAKMGIIQEADDKRTGRRLLRDIHSGLAVGDDAANMWLIRRALRSAAVDTARQLLVLGNSLAVLPEDDDQPMQVYGFRDWVCRRDMSGNVLEIITRDKKAFSAFDEATQNEIRAARAKKRKKCKDDEEITLYTWVKRVSKNKVKATQWAEDVKLKNIATYNQNTMPWLVLTWNLTRGDHYGRGLVEDYSGSFHALEILTTAITTGAALAAEVKYLVAPTSLLDVADLNESPNGSFHVGNEGDVTCIQLDKAQDMETAQFLIERLERRLSRVFLYSQGTTRDAERVTAHELQLTALELEQSLGGVYSRLGVEWQLPLARRALYAVRADIDDPEVDVTLVAGMDTLSKAAQVQNFRYMQEDLQMASQQVPEVTERYDWERLIDWIAASRNVPLTEFMLDEDEYEQKQQQRRQDQQQQLADEGMQQVGVEAGKTMAQGLNTDG